VRWASTRRRPGSPWRGLCGRALLNPRVVMFVLLGLSGRRGGMKKPRPGCVASSRRRGMNTMVSHSEASLNCLPHSRRPCTRTTNPGLLAVLSPPPPWPPLPPSPSGAVAGLAPRATRHPIAAHHAAGHAAAGSAACRAHRAAIMPSGSLRRAPVGAIAGRSITFREASRVFQRLRRMKLVCGPRRR